MLVHASSGVAHHATAFAERFGGRANRPLLGLCRGRPYAGDLVSRRASWAEDGELVAPTPRALRAHDADAVPSDDSVLA